MQDCQTEKRENLEIKKPSFVCSTGWSLSRDRYIGVNALFNTKISLTICFFLLCINLLLKINKTSMSTWWMKFTTSLPDAECDFVLSISDCWSGLGLIVGVGIKKITAAIKTNTYMEEWIYFYTLFRSIYLCLIYSQMDAVNQSLCMFELSVMC